VTLNRRAVSTSLTSLVLVVLVVAAVVVIYAYTAGYFGNTAPEVGVLQVQNLSQFDGELHVYIKNVGRSVVKLKAPVEGSTVVYIEERGWYNYTASTWEIQEGVTADITISGFNETYLGKTISVKIVSVSGAFATADVKITEDAVPESILYGLTVKVEPSGSGKITFSHQPPYHHGDIITVYQVSNVGYQFSGWSGDGVNSGENRVVNITGKMLVTAAFKPVVYPINLSIEGHGIAQKIPDKSGYDAKSLITLTATEAAPGWVFQGWSSDSPNIAIDNEASETTYAVINGAGNIKATFTQIQYDVHTITVGHGEAEISSESLYTYSSTIELKANETFEGWSFQTWSTNTPNIVIENMTSIMTRATVYGPGTITAKFVMDNPPEIFTLIAIPDTQGYSQSYPWIFDNQTQWIVNNIAEKKIAYVTNEGDIVNSYTSTSQWINANHSISILNSRVDYGMLPGNHDGGSIGSAGENLVAYTSYFGAPNSYRLFTAGGEDYLIFHFQYNVPDSILSWANTTITDYPERRVIVVTHSYLNTDSSRTPEGTVIWQRFVKPHSDQVFLVLCGHMHGEANRTDTVNGNTVYQLLADYQSLENGGNGWLRIMEFRPGEELIYVNTYSPYLNQYQTDSDSEFTIPY
jgi:hypothetical protein